MNKDINLAVKKQSSSEKKIIVIFWVTAVIFLIVTLFLSIFLFFFKTQSSFSSIKNEEATLSSNFLALSDKIAKYIFISDRLKSISDIILKRSSFDEVIDLVLKQTPQNINTSSLTIDKNTIGIQLSSSSLLAIDSMLNNWLATADKKKYKRIVLGGIEVDEKNGIFTASLKIDL